jgi:hypothetical protein
MDPFRIDSQPTYEDVRIASFTNNRVIDEYLSGRISVDRSKR